MNTARELSSATPYANTGYGPKFVVLEFGDANRVAVVEPDVAWWALVERDALGEALAGEFVGDFRSRADSFRDEMENLRFGLKPSAVYFNPTDRCNFNCSYCYLPEELRRNGKT